MITYQQQLRLPARVEHANRFRLVRANQGINALLQGYFLRAHVTRLIIVSMRLFAADVG
jgi:hypothetical protein